MFCCFLCQEGLGQKTAGGIQLDWMWRSKHKACPHGVKKARWNVGCLCTEEKSRWRESLLTHSGPGREARNSHTPLCKMLNPHFAQDWANTIVLGFQSCAPHFLPHFLLTLFQKNYREIYMHFHFKKRLPQYVGHTGEIDQE